MHQLNRNRLFLGRLVLASAFIVCIFTRSKVPNGTFLHELEDCLGLSLVIVCMLGRLYCTMQIGGKKSAELVTTGIYSVVRNPLYMFSFLGIIGVGFVSNEMTVLAALLASFLLIYIPLIAREEAFLSQAFGEAFSAYTARVPRLIPDFRHYTAPKEVTVNLAALHGALRDALCWLVPLIYFELIEWAQGSGLVKPLASLW